MHRQQETKNRTKKEALFFVSRNCPNYGAFILSAHFTKNICYQ